MTFSEAPAPRTSPWGKPDTVRRLAAGVYTVDTPSHGGIFLSAERNAEVPPIARDRAGWYEEDCDWAIAALVHADAFSPDEQAAAITSAKNWNPDAYTAITGQPVALSESHTLQDRAFKAATRNEFVVASAFGDWSPFVGKGEVGVCARRESDGAEQWALVSAANYAARQGFYVLEEGRDRFIEKPERTH